MKTTMTLTVVMAFVVVVLNGAGLRAMGLRHSGAHMMVEFASVVIVGFAIAVAHAVMVRK